MQQMFSSFFHSILCHSIYLHGVMIELNFLFFFFTIKIKVDENGNFEFHTINQDFRL